MNQAGEKDTPSPDVVGQRWPELLVALALMVMAVLVITDSLRVGIGWADDGPRSGYFPFSIGLVLLVSAGWVAGKQLLNWRRANPAFAEATQLRSVWSVLWPTAVYVALIPALSIYVASAVLIAYFMLRHGPHPLALSMAVALGVPAVFFAVFERWFLVPLPKGALGAWLGL
jgi:putative tricarboxylic transport membrane protein